MRKFVLYVTLALAAALPGVALRVAGKHLGPLPDAAIFGVALLGAGFLLSWGAEAAEEHVSQGLTLAVLALVTVLPEYAVDIYYTFQAGRHPSSEYVQFAAANMTGANRLLIGTAWPLIALLFWWRTRGRERAVPLRAGNTVEVAFLALASLYAFVIVWKRRIDLWDMAVLLVLFAAYLWRVSRLPKKADEGDEEDDEDEEVGPAAVLAALPAARQWAVMGALTVLAAGIILAVAEPFAEALVGAGRALGMNPFLLIQWVAPLAGEAPEIIICVLFTLALRPASALGALVSDKINQWTLLVGMLPLVFSLAAGHVSHLPLDARQREEFFLTAAQSVFGVAVLLRLRLGVGGALTLLGLFFAQIALAWGFRQNDARAIAALTGMGWLYLVLAAGLFVTNRAGIAAMFGAGLLGRPGRDRKPAALQKGNGE